MGLGNSKKEEKRGVAHSYQTFSFMISLYLCLSPSVSLHWGTSLYCSFYRQLFHHPLICINEFFSSMIGTYIHIYVGVLERMNYSQFIFK